MRIAVVGAGAMGAYIVGEIARSEPERGVLVIDADGTRAQDVVKHLGIAKAAHAQCDARDSAVLAGLLDEVRVVVNAAQYDVNIDVMRACLAARCHYLDLGGMFHMTRRQLELADEFRRIGITAVLGMGAAPGMTNVLARLACDQLDTVDTIECAFAVVAPDAPVSSVFVPPYSIRTIMQEFCDESVQFLDGALRSQQPLAGRRAIQFAPPIGLVDCLYTLHSEPATLPGAFASKGVREVSWRLCLPPQLEGVIKAFAAAGLGSTEPLALGDISVRPVDVLAASIERGVRARAPSTTPYMEHGAIRVQVTGTRQGAARSIVVECSRSETSSTPDVAGIMTGTPCAIAAMMIARGEGLRAGAHGPESVIPPSEIVRQLGLRRFVTAQIDQQTL